MFRRSTNRITKLQYFYGCATLSGDYLWKLDLKHYWLALDLWVANLRCTLTWFPAPTESLGYTIYKSVQL